MGSAEPNLGSFRPPRPVSTPATPTIHGEGSGFANWGQVPYQMEGAGDLTRDVPFEEM